LPVCPVLGPEREGARHGDRAAAGARVHEGEGLGLTLSTVVSDVSLHIKSTEVATLSVVDAA
jgi:hypothetical protein